MEYSNPQAWVALLESHFGPRAGRIIATALLALASLALAFFLGRVIWDNGGQAAYQFFSGLAVPGITIDNIAAALATLIWFVIAFGVVVVAILFFLGRALFKRSVSQTALDRLAELRNEGISNVYVVQPKTDAEFNDWKYKYKEWEGKILDHIKTNFPKADYLTALHLGVVLNANFPALRYNDEHERLLMFFAKRLQTVEAILTSYRR